MASGFVRAGPALAAVDGQVGREGGQLAVGLSGQGLAGPQIILIPGQPALGVSALQDADGGVAVPVRRPDLADGVRCPDLAEAAAYCHPRAH